MLRFASYSLLKLATIAALASTTTFSHAQPPAAPTPPPAMAPLASPAATAESGTAFNAVREAIARQDYNAARQALDQVRQSDPNNAGIAVYENIIERRQTQGQGIGVQSPLPTVRAGVTPEPRPAATPTPAPTPVITPAPVATPPPSGMGDKVKNLMENDMARYGIIGLGALIFIGLVIWFLKKRRAGAEVEEEAPAITSGLGSYGDPLAGNDMGLPTSPLSTDYSTGPSAYGEMPESAPLGGSALGGSALGGSALGSDMPAFSMPTFHSDEEEEEVAPRRPAPAPKPVEDEGPVNLFDEGPQAPKAMPAELAPHEPMEPVEPAPLSSPAEPGSLDALGINFGGSETSPATPESLSPAFDDEQTVILSQPEPPTSNRTPASTPSVAPGTVDLEDIFGSQPLPGSVQAEDKNSETLPTFVSTPGADNPEDSQEMPPAQNLRPSVETSSETQSISFEELFGAPDASSMTTPSVPPAEETPAAPEPKAMGDTMSIEDALAATIGAMADEKPFEEQPTVLESAPEEESSTESLDERSERMFLDQMEKARTAYNEKNWRQAVHFLSIASALHPEHEEARQMLKEARAEKRKAEESV